MAQTWYLLLTFILIFPEGQYMPSPPSGQQQQATTVVVNQPAYTVIQHFRETPVRIKCQYCQADIVTATLYETGTMTWIACFIIFFVG